MFFKFKHFPYVQAIHVFKDNELVFKLANKCTEDTLFSIGDKQYSIRTLSDIGRQYLNRFIFNESAAEADSLTWTPAAFGAFSGFLADGLCGHILAVIPENHLAVAVICDQAETHPEAVNLVELAGQTWK